MGTWNTAINGNDTFLDIYQHFFDLYNQGQGPESISSQILQDFGEMFDDHEDRFNSLFGLALAQWETKSLDAEIFEQVKGIIERGDDLILWQELGADEKVLKQRKKVLDKFLSDISIPRKKAKRRVRPKFQFEKIDIVKSTSPDSKKELEIGEVYIDKKYDHTAGLIIWNSGGGGSVLYYWGQGKSISAKWLDSKTLEITHDQDIEFTKKDKKAFFYGDDITINYIGIPAGK
jgi:hypothetical protein